MDHYSLANTKMVNEMEKELLQDLMDQYFKDFG